MGRRAATMLRPWWVRRSCTDHKHVCISPATWASDAAFVEYSCRPHAVQHRTICWPDVDASPEEVHGAHHIPSTVTMRFGIVVLLKNALPSRIQHGRQSLRV